MLRRGMIALKSGSGVNVGGFRPKLPIRKTTIMGVGVGSLDVITTAEHLLVEPMSDGNPLLMEIGYTSPIIAYMAFVSWFVLVAAVAVRRDDYFGFGADIYLFVAFGLAGVANAAYFLTGTLIFKTFVWQYPLLTNLYLLLIAPLGSLGLGIVCQKVMNGGTFTK